MRPTQLRRQRQWVCRTTMDRSVVRPMHRRHRDRREGSWLLCPCQGGLTLRYRAQVRNNNEFLFATVRSIAACVTVKADRGSARARLKKSAIKCRLFDVKAQAPQS